MPAWLDGFWQAIGGFGLGAALLNWIAKRQIGRLDRLEESVAAKASREELKKIAERMFDKLDEHTKESRISMDKLHDKLDRSIAAQSQINLEVARNLGRD